MSSTAPAIEIVDFQSMPEDEALAGDRDNAARFRLDPALAPFWQDPAPAPTTGTDADAPPRLPEDGRPGRRLIRKRPSRRVKGSMRMGSHSVSHTAENVARAPEPAPPRRRSLIEHIDESALQPAEFVVEAPFSFARGHVSAVGARRGTGKTTVAVGIGVHVAANLSWLRAKVAGGRVLYLDYEYVPQQIVKARDEIVASLENDHPSIRELITPDTFRVRSFTALEKASGLYLDHVLAEVIADVGQDYSLIIVDGFGAAFADLDTNDGQQVAARMRDLLELAQSSQAAVLFLDHTPKNGNLTLTGSGKKEDLVASLHFLKGDINAGRLEWLPDKIRLGKKDKAFNFRTQRREGELSFTREDGGKGAKSPATSTGNFRADLTDTKLRPEDLDSGEAVVAVLHESGPLRTRELEEALANATGFAASAVRKKLTESGALTRLSDAGRIIVEKDPADRRAKIHRLPTQEIVR